MTTVLTIVLLVISPLFGPGMPVIVLCALVVLSMGKAADRGQAAIAAATTPAQADSAFGCGALAVVAIGGLFLLILFMAAGGAALGGGL